MTAREFDEFLWAARPALLALKSELAAQRFLLAARRLAAVLRKAGFNPDQPRDDQGRWIDSGGVGDQEQDSQVVLAGGPRGRSGYPIDLLEEEALDAFVERRFPSVLPFTFLFGQFDSPTGYEAYARNSHTQPVMRATTGVTVPLRRTDRSEKGYYVETAWPTNED